VLSAHRTRRDGSAGFTLIELMIVVAIIGLLASIAIPNFIRFQLRSKASEGKVSLGAIRSAQESHFAEYNTYVQAAANPAAVPGKSRASWTPSVDFTLLGWAPEGDVFFQYGVATGPAGGPPYDHYTAEAVSDIDDDSSLNAFGYVKSNLLGGTVAGDTAGDAAVDCPATGVWNPASASRALERVGPCQVDMGQSIF
jgi:type IV pilus assembly protein PilA